MPPRADSRTATRSRAGQLPDAASVPLTEEDFVDELVRQWRNEWPDDDILSLALRSRLMRLASAEERVALDELRAAGLSRGEAFILTTLRRVGAPFQLSSGELAERILSTSRNISVPLKRLEERGFINRELHPHDRRSIVVSLTSAGKSCVDDMLEHRRRVPPDERNVFASLTTEEQQTLSALMKKALLHLGDLPRGSA